jgi:hypothetical protein
LYGVQAASADYGESEGFTTGSRAFLTYLDFSSLHT